MKRILEVKKKIGNLSKNSKNPFFKSAYLDLNGLLNAVEPLLQEQGLVLIQPIEEGEVFSRIIDSDSGNIIIESGIMLPNLTDPQKLGSAITYFRRYTLKSLLAIAESDDDGNLASTKSKRPTLTVGMKQWVGGLEKKTPLSKMMEYFDLSVEDQERYNNALTK